MPPNGYYNLLLYDGVCDLARKIDTLTGDMDFMEDSLVLSSSGNNMFVSFDIGNYGPWKGFTAKIHYGIEFKIFPNLTCLQTVSFIVFFS